MLELIFDETLRAIMLEMTFDEDYLRAIMLEMTFDENDLNETFMLVIDF